MVSYYFLFIIVFIFLCFNKVRLGQDSEEYFLFYNLVMQEQLEEKYPVIGRSKVKNYDCQIMLSKYNTKGKSEPLKCNFYYYLSDDE